TRELHEAIDVRVDRGLTRGQDFRRGRLRRAQELAKEAPLREELVLQDVADRARARMRAVRQVGIRELAPDRDDLVALARVRVQQMLREGERRAGNVRVRDRGVGVAHRHGLHPPCWGRSGMMWCTPGEATATRDIYPRSRNFASRAAASRVRSWSGPSASRSP